MLRKLDIWVSVIVCFSVSPALGGVLIHVPCDQPTIQAAINAAGDGDTVLVAPGTHRENITFMSKT